MQQVGDPGAARLRLQIWAVSGSWGQPQHGHQRAVWSLELRSGGSRSALGRGFCPCAPFLGRILEGLTWPQYLHHKEGRENGREVAKPDRNGLEAREAALQWECLAEKLGPSNKSQSRVRGDMIIIGKCLRGENLSTTKALLSQVKKTSTRTHLWELEAEEFEFEPGCRFLKYG